MLFACSSATFDVCGGGKSGQGSSCGAGAPDALSGALLEVGAELPDAEKLGIPLTNVRACDGWRGAAAVACAPFVPPMEVCDREAISLSPGVRIGSSWSAAANVVRLVTCGSFGGRLGSK